MERLYDEGVVPGRDLVERPHDERAVPGLDHASTSSVFASTITFRHDNLARS